MSIRHAILGLLSEGPLHGYGLKAAYEESLVPGASLNIGQVYPALERLQTDGHVTSEVVAQSERPDRKVFTITDAGRRELANWLATAAPRESDLRNETFLKVSLALRLRRQGGDADPFAVIAVARRETLKSLHELTAAREQAERDGGALPEMMLLELAILRQNAFHQWLDRCEEMLRREGGGR
jgi:DNA-binding PadR family transcriptional regulator